jgi:outer membrane murein-binding lipoprotein Lpp
MKLFGLILVLSVPLVFSVVIDCKFKSGDWVRVDNVYYCMLRSDPSITERGTIITAATGSHLNSMNHASVTGFYTTDSSYTINFMPRGLIDVFPSLIAISIKSSHLKEIRRADLQPFPKLKYLDLANNDIKTIERDLFKYNPLLLLIYLENNKINRVHPNVFDNLNQLSSLDVRNNTCVTTGYRADRAGVLQLVASIKSQCSSNIGIMINEIEEDAIEMSEQVQGLNSKIDNLTTEFRNHVDITSKANQDLARITSENDAKLAENFNKQLMNLNLTIQSKFDEQQAKFDEKFNEKFTKLSDKVDELHQHIVAIVDAILNEKNNTTES